MTCKCGCGQRTLMHRGKINSYVRGHNRVKKRLPVRHGTFEGENVALIPLSTGNYAMVSEEDCARVLTRLWTCNPHGYAMASIRAVGGGWTVVSLHRFIKGSPEGKDIDHRNGVLLDCRRSNLRVCSTEQNARNQKSQEGCSSSYKGVSLHACGKWECYIKVSGKKTHLGLHKSEIDAAKRYNIAAIEYFGEFAKLNEI